MQILNTQILVKIHDLNRKNVKTLQFDEFFVFQKPQKLNGKTKILSPNLQCFDFSMYRHELRLPTCVHGLYSARKSKHCPEQRSEICNFVQFSTHFSWV